MLVISGLAYGIDVTAHRKSISLNIPTVGVLGHGLSMIYPHEHKGVSENMIKNGGVLTEFTYQQGPEREHFPMRNRIVAGMCDALIVVETKERGGSMITAELANGYNKNVFAVPGRARDKKFGGGNLLIKDHKAQLVECADDVIGIMGWKLFEENRNIQKQLFVELSEREQVVIEILKTENEVAIDISTLRSATGGITTIDPGFKNTGSCASEITFLDGEKGILRYRGYSIEELADKADFLEVAYLLIFGELPTKQQLEKLSDDIKERSIIDEDLRIILNSYPKSAHPMGILSSLTSGLVAFDPSAVDIDDDEDMYDAILNLLAKIPVLVAWVYRRRKGLPLEYGDTSLGYVENIAKMMFQRPNKEYIQNPDVKL